MSFAFFAALNCVAEKTLTGNNWVVVGQRREQVIITHHLAENPTLKSGLCLIPWLAHFPVQATDEKAD